MKHRHNWEPYEKTPRDKLVARLTRKKNAARIAKQNELRKGNK